MTPSGDTARGTQPEIAPVYVRDPPVVPRQVPVVIVGGGPSGLYLSLDLASRGIRSIVIEPRVEVDITRPRAKTANARTMTYLRRLGLADRLRDAAPLSAEYSEDVIFCSSLVGQEVSRFRNAFQVARGRYDLQPESGQQVPQPVVEKVLREAVDEVEEATLLLGARAVELDLEPSRPRVLIVDENGQSHWVQCDFIIGADGSGSLVRSALGIALEGSSESRQNLNVLFRSEQLADIVALDPAIQYWVLSPESSGMVGRFDLDLTWWAIIQGVDADADPDPVSLVQGLIGVPISVDTVAADIWTARMLLASSYGRGRVFLVGDAAHLNPPWGGHGFNTCIGDAANLAWKLAASFGSWAGPGLLSSYEAERRPVAARTIRDASANGSALAYDFADPLLAEASARGEAARHATADALKVKTAEFSSLGLVLGYHYADSPIVVHDGTPLPIEDPIQYTPSSSPGSLLPHVWLPDGRSLYDRLGSDFTLLVDPAGPEAARFAQEAVALSAAYRIPLQILEVNWRDELGPSHAILVRPDQHVAWRGDDPAALGDVFLAATGWHVAHLEGVLPAEAARAAGDRP